jgi:flagellar biosynthesis GTPase FlhF
LSNRVKEGFFGASHNPISIISQKPTEVGKAVQDRSSIGIGSDSFVVPRRARPKKTAVKARKRRTQNPRVLRASVQQAAKLIEKTKAEIEEQAETKAETKAEVEQVVEEASGSVQAIEEERRNNPYSQQANEVRKAVRGESNDKAVNSVVQDAKELSRRMNALKSQAGAGRADPEYIRRATELVNEVVRSQPNRNRDYEDESPGSNRF